MAPKSDVKPVTSLIPFTRFPDRQAISLLLLRFRCHSPLQSARFFHELVIPSPPLLDKDDYLEAIHKRDQILCDYVELCFPALLPGLQKKLHKSKTAFRLPSTNQELILLPIRPQSIVESSVGVGVWIDFMELTDRFQCQDMDCNFGNDIDVYLPTMSLLRANAVPIIKYFNRIGLDLEQTSFEDRDSNRSDVAATEVRSPSDIACRDDYYSCAKCSKALFNKDVVEHHESLSVSRSCASLFLSDSARGVFGELAEVSGKLSCPYCGYRLGSYDWSGIPCSCGSWLAPAIQITSSRVDSMKRRSGGNRVVINTYCNPHVVVPSV